MTSTERDLQIMQTAQFATLYTWRSRGLQRTGLGSDTQGHSAETHFCHAPVEINHAETKRAPLALTCIIIFGLFFSYSLSLSLGLKYILSMWNDSFLISCYGCTGTCNSRVSWHDRNTVS